MYTIAMPVYDGVKSHTMTSLLNLKDMPQLGSFKFISRFRDGGIGRSRSILATRFLEDPSSEILIFIDSDIMFDPDDVYKLLKAQEDGHDVVAGGYVMTNGLIAIRNKPDMPISKMSNGAIYEVEYTSTGFFSISKSALRDIKDQLSLPLLHPNHPDGRCYPFFEAGRDWTGKHDFFLSEDWDFCEKAIQCGYKIYWHTGVLVTHVKEMVLIAKAGIGPPEIGRMAGA